MKKVLISDQLAAEAVEIFVTRKIKVDFKPEVGKNPELLKKIIGDYDGIAIRSNTKLTKDILEKAKSLSIIGRAGIGIDNVDLKQASVRGIVVMNTPFGNSTTAAEHAIAMMFSIVRQIPSANASTQSGKWEKSKYLGEEITGKTLGLVGAGNIGSVVASRAIGLKMKVLAFDPFLSEKRATETGITKILELDELLSLSDIVSLHLPLTPKTTKLITRHEISKMKRGAKLINCARGGLVDEEAVAEAIISGHLGGAAFDVFEDEPATSNVLFGLENVVCTPHLGASTKEAQLNVSLQIANQMSDYLVEGAISNAINAPSVSAEEAPILKPWIETAQVLGSFAGQVSLNAIKEIEIEFVGYVGELNLKPLISALTASLLRPIVGDGSINMVSAQIIARERGIKITEIRKDSQGAFGSYIRLVVITENQSRSVAGTVYSDSKPRFIQIKGINLEAEPQPFMIYTVNKDSPGFIGSLGTKLGALGINIATFALGRSKKKGEAIALLGVDEKLNKGEIDEILQLPNVLRAHALEF